MKSYMAQGPFSLRYIREGHSSIQKELYLVSHRGWIGLLRHN